MKILLYSHTFWPNIGGVEDIGHNLASQLVSLGQRVTVVTPVAATPERETTYTVVRQPSFKQLWKLVQEHDVVHSNGIALALLLPALLLNKPFTWAHHGYQLQCIDGAGWVDGGPAPMQPWQSFQFHLHLYGLARALPGFIKLLGRRLAAQLVSANVATSKHLTIRQPAPRQVVIYNPVDLNLFSAADAGNAARRIKEARVPFTYVGRLVTEKGVDDLLHALSTIPASKNSDGCAQVQLRIIGAGPERENLEQLARNLDLNERVEWAGPKVDDELKLEVEAAAIFVIPSAWEEPGALTVMNLMSAGKPLIVAQRGFLAECAADACLTFANGDRQQLAAAMQKLAADQSLQIKLAQNGLERIKEYRSQESVEKLLQLFQELVQRSPLSVEETRL